VEHRLKLDLTHLMGGDLGDMAREAGELGQIHTVTKAEHLADGGVRGISYQALDFGFGAEDLTDFVSGSLGKGRC